MWDNIYDWHVAYQQPLNVSRLTDGRYAMLFSFTTLLFGPIRTRTMWVMRSTSTHRGGLAERVDVRYFASSHGSPLRTLSSTSERFPRRSNVCNVPRGTDTRP